MDIVILLFVIQGAIGLFDILGRPAASCADHPRPVAARPPKEWNSAR